MSNDGNPFGIAPNHSELLDAAGMDDGESDATAYEVDEPPGANLVDRVGVDLSDGTVTFQIGQSWKLPDQPSVEKYRELMEGAQMCWPQQPTLVVTSLCVAATHAVALDDDDRLQWAMACLDFIEHDGEGGP